MNWDSKKCHPKATSAYEISYISLVNWVFFQINSKILFNLCSESKEKSQSADKKSFDLFYAALHGPFEGIALLNEKPQEPSEGNQEK